MKGDGVTRTPAPTCGCIMTTGHTVTLQPNERIVGIDVWKKNHPTTSGLYRWVRATFTLNTGVVLDY